MSNIRFLLFSIICMLFVNSCKEPDLTPDCEKMNTGAILFHNTTTSLDSIHVFLNGQDKGIVRLANELMIYNLPVGKNLYSFKYRNSTINEDTITITRCGTTHYDIDYNPASDKRLKKNIMPLQSALLEIGKLKIYSFEYDKPKNYNAYLPNGKHYGFMAQELKDVYPTFVQKNNVGYYSVNYQEMVPILIKGMQEQQAQINDLKKEIEYIKSLVKNQSVAMK